MPPKLPVSDSADQFPLRPIVMLPCPCRAAILFVNRMQAGSLCLKTITDVEASRLSFKPQLRLGRRDQGGQNETEQPDHSASSSDSITASTR
jgi:hypothetical protein